MAQGKSSKKFWTAVVALTVFAGPTALGAKAKSLKPAKKATPTQKSADPFQGNGETGDKETNPSGAKKSPPSNPSMIPLETTATLGAPSGAGFFDLQITSMTYKSTYGDSETKISVSGIQPMVGFRVNKSLTFKLVPRYLSVSPTLTFTTIGASGAYDISESISIGLGVESATVAYKSGSESASASLTRPVAGIEYRAPGIHSVAEIKLQGKAPRKEFGAQQEVSLLNRIAFGISQYAILDVKYLSGQDGILWYRSRTSTAVTAGIGHGNKALNIEAAVAIGKGEDKYVESENNQSNSSQGINFQARFAVGRQSNVGVGIDLHDSVSKSSGTGSSDTKTKTQAIRLVYGTKI